MTTPTTRDVAIVGGGAAGYFAAITCAETHPGARVTLLEASHHPLAKVRISGGGRCNVTHACFDPARLVKAYPRGERELRGPFSKFQPRDTMEWFEKRGVPLKTEADGRVFPVSDEAESIAHCLETAAASAGIRIRLGGKVESLRKLEAAEGAPRLELQIQGGVPELFHDVLLATGGTRQGHELARSLGHTITSLAPSLFTLNIEDPRLEDLEGLSSEKARLRLKIEKSKFEETGPVLITHWGLSGPAVLKLSSIAARELAQAEYEAELTINWVGGKSSETIMADFAAFKERYPRKQVTTNAMFGVRRRHWERLCESAGIPSDKIWAEVSRKELQRLAEELADGRYQVSGKGVFKEEFVTCGGVALKEVNFQTMESRLVPGLHFAGEILDIDAITGGYNFQAAWTTGWLAGNHMGATPDEA